MILRRLLLSLMVAAAPSTAGADWLVFVGGGIRETRGPLEVRGRQVVFHDLGGTLMSLPAEEVDVPASAFLSYQVGGRPLVPRPTAPRAPEPPPAAVEGDPDCVAVKILRVVSAETYELALGGKSETVHLACLDAPETNNRFPELAYFGTESNARVERLLSLAPVACLTEEIPARRDLAGHRVAYLKLGDGRDLGAEIVGGGFGVLRAAGCGRRARYEALEARARAVDSGHWGPSANAAAVAVVASAVAFRAPPAARRGGGRS